MSWFSDFAKTALNEAQKRIDKVLDIDEDEKNETKTIDKFQNEQSNIPPHISVPETTQKLSSSLSPKFSTSNGSNKKRGKPMKLGSSLSKKTAESKLKKTSGDSKKELASGNLSLTSNKNVCDESNTNFELSSTLSGSDIISNSKLKTDHEETTSNTNNSSLLNGDHQKRSIDINQVLPVIDDSKRIGQSTFTAADSAVEKTSFQNELAQSIDLQFRSEAPGSPCGSTTASSEIEILDHESNASEASAVLKMNELDCRLRMISTDTASRIGRSPDLVESEEASDIGRISGCCSSPYSVGSNDGSAPFHSQQNLLSKIEPDIEIEKENTNSTLCQNEGDSNIPTEPEDDSVDLREKNDTPLLTDAEKASRDFEETSRDRASLQRQSDAEVAERVSDPPNITDSMDDNDVISPVVISPSVDYSEQKIYHDHFVPDQIPPPSLPDTSARSEVPKETVEQSELSRGDELTSEKFEAYEQQLLTLSLGNAKLNEENDNLRSELSNLRAKQEQEFDERQRNAFNTIEKLSQQIQELELAKSEIANHLSSVQSDLSTRLTNEQVQSLISEKEESIQGLLEEGEALSKQHLQLNNTIKKIRAKLSDKESSLKELNESSDKLKEENKLLKSRLTEIQGQSSEDRGAAKRLSEAYQEREAELSSMKMKLEDAEEKKRSAQSTLDAAYKDLAELNKKLAALQSDREAELKESESSVMKRMQQELAKLQQDHEHQLHMNMLQMGELRDAMERNEAVFARKEDQLRKEVRDLQQRLQESEMRNQELSESISESTRPILRQMENLQSTYSTQAKTWETLEKNLTSRLSEAQMQLAASQEKERSVQMSLVDSKSRVFSLEQQLSESSSEKMLLDIEVKELRASAWKYNENIAKIRAELELSEKQCEEIKSKSRRDRLTLENQLDMEKVRAEVEKKKVAAQLEMLQKEKERLLWMNRSDSVVSSASALNAETESVASSNDAYLSFDIFDRQTSTTGQPAGVYDSLRSGSSNSALMENLQSQIKMRDGEIQQLQGEINTLERTRSSMAEEIVRLTNENEDLTESTKDILELQRKLKDVESRYEAVLTMYGEKAEEADELRLDLQDVKAMYRNQIDALMKSQ